jgi:hypothetical protein
LCSLLFSLCPIADVAQLSRKANLRLGKKEDDGFLLQHSLVFPLLALSLKDGAYREWLWRADMRPFYAEMQTFCQLMLLRRYGDSSQLPRFVLLKSPWHLSFFRAFHATVSLYFSVSFRN